MCVSNNIGRHQHIDCLRWLLLSIVPTLVFVCASFYSESMVSLIINVSEYIPRPVLWVIVIILLPFAAIIDIVNHIRDRGWIWIIFAFFIGFLIACYVSSAPQGDPGAMTVAHRQSFLFKIMQKTLGRDVE